jgi:hypothetical protein
LNRPKIVAGDARFDQVILSAVLQREIAHRVEGEAGQRHDGKIRTPRSRNEFDQNLKAGQSQLFPFRLRGRCTVGTKCSGVQYSRSSLCGSMRRTVVGGGRSSAFSPSHSAGGRPDRAQCVLQKQWFGFHKIHGGFASRLKSTGSNDPMESHGRHKATARAVS